MADIVVFHHAQGLTPGVVDFADGRRCAGHTVRTPDLFEGRTFDTVDQGVGHAHQIGFDTVIDRGAQAVDGLQAGLVYAGFSLGVLPAQALAQTRPGARAALLFHACVSVCEFGTSWPDDVPVQVHAMQADPFFVNGGDLDAVHSARRRGRGRRAVPLPRRPAPVRGQLIAVLRRGGVRAPDAAGAHLPGADVLSAADFARGRRSA